MGFFSDSMRLLKIAKKPSRKEVWIVIRVTVVGMGLLGVLGFLIKIVGEVVVKGLTRPPT
jgi:protein transport protein SEC61 subunit gamma-like protein